MEICMCLQCIRESRSLFHTCIYCAGMRILILTLSKKSNKYFPNQIKLFSKKINLYGNAFIGNGAVLRINYKTVNIWMLGVDSDAWILSPCSLRMKTGRFWAHSLQSGPHHCQHLPKQGGNVWETWARCLRLPPTCLLCHSHRPRQWHTGGGRAPLNPVTSPLLMTSGCPRRHCWTTWTRRTEGKCVVCCSGGFLCLCSQFWSRRRFQTSSCLCLHLRLLRRTRVGGENRV